MAFSGGADSTALAVILRRLGYRISLGHVDHGMRPESGAEAEHCKRVASQMKVPIDVARVRVDPPTEAEARRVRYQALSKMAARAGAGKIATGHTLDDNLETILMRLARGGRAFGIPPRRGVVVRPLLDLRRSDTEGVCAAARIDYTVDPSNLDEGLTRNRMRWRVVPYLGEEEVAALLAMAEANRMQAATLEEEILVAEAKGSILWGHAGVRIARPWLEEVPQSVRRAAIRSAMGRFGLEPSSRLVSDVEAKVLASTGARLDLPAGWSVWAEPFHLVVGRPPDAPELPEVALDLPGTTVNAEWGIEIRTSFEEPGRRELSHAPAEAVVDAGVAAGPLHLRPWRPGDRFRPLGSPGTKKLQDYFVDSKVPRWERRRIPILVAGDRIVWVAGFRIDEAFKLTPKTKRVLRIQIFRLDYSAAGPLASRSS